jgi:uncharacterized spore protein YtfJ
VTGAVQAAAIRRRIRIPLCFADDYSTTATVVSFTGLTDAEQQPVTADGVTVIAAASVRGGGGDGGRDEQGEEGQGGGFGLHARPVGAYFIRNGEVQWTPAVDVNGVLGMLGAITFTWVMSRARVARRHAKVKAHSGRA